MKKPLSYFLEPIPLPPEDLEPPAEKFPVSSDCCVPCTQKYLHSKIELRVALCQARVN